MLIHTVAVLTLSALCCAPAAAGVESADPPAGERSLAFRSVEDGKGAMLIWLDRLDGGVHALRFAQFDGTLWSAATTIREGGDFFANWADTPSVARYADGSLLASWLQKAGPGTYAYDVMLARSTDEGVTWTNLGKAHDDGVLAEHGFVSMLPEGDAIRLFWLDGRNMTGDGGGHGHGGGNMTLRTALVGPDGSVRESTQLDSRTCECCATGATLTKGGPIVVYRDRGEQEVRDIAVIRAGENGWTEPALVHEDNWRTPACPVNGPAIASANGTTALAWYTITGGAGRVQLAFSDDDGASWGAPIEIAGPRDMGSASGRVDVVLDPSGQNAIVTWLHTDGASASVRARRATRDGAPTPAESLFAVSPTRSSGFPNLTPLGGSGSYLLTWAEVDESHNTRVRSSVLTFD